MRDLKNQVPQNDWFCQRCDYLCYNNLNSSGVTCIYCRDLTGIMIPLAKEYSRNNHDCSWVHITCVNWNKHIYFKEISIEMKDYSQSNGSSAAAATPNGNMETAEESQGKRTPVTSKLNTNKTKLVSDWVVGLSGKIVGDLSRAYWGSVCVLCREPGGATIACDQRKPDCNRRFHIRCAIKVGLIRPMINMDRDSGKNRDQDEVEVPIFCHLHDERFQQE